jgi:hypothetical protein
MESTSSAGLRTFAPSDVTRSWAAGHVVGRQLHPDPRCTVDEHHVKVILGIDGAAEHPGPEAALGGEVGGVEHHDLMIDAYRVLLSRVARRVDGIVETTACSTGQAIGYRRAPDLGRHRHMSDQDRETRGPVRRGRRGWPREEISCI